MKRNIFTLIIGIMTVYTALAQTCQISGTITSKKNGRFVEEVELILKQKWKYGTSLNDASSKIYTIKTDWDGYFVTDIEMGTYNLFITKNGFQSIDIDYSFFTDECIINFGLTKGSSKKIRFSAPQTCGSNEYEKVEKYEKYRQKNTIKKIDFKDFVNYMSSNPSWSSNSRSNWRSNIKYIDTLKFTSGENYVGLTLLNNISLFGKLEYSNGDIYTGEFKDGYINGYGKMNFENNRIYEGFWENGKFHGNGTMYFNKNNLNHKYIGEYRNGKRNGKGQYFFPKDEDKISGPLSSNIYEIIVSPPGKIIKNQMIFYSGEWSNDHYEGLGVLTFKNSGKYIGEFTMGMIDGKGKLFDSEGYVVYNGVYINGKAEGITVKEQFENFELLKLKRAKEKLEREKEKTRKRLEEENLRKELEKRKRKEELLLAKEKMRNEKKNNPSNYYCKIIKSYYPKIKVHFSEQEGKYKNCIILETLGNKIVAKITLIGFWGDTFYRYYEFYLDETDEIYSYQKIDKLGASYDNFVNCEFELIDKGWKENGNAIFSDLRKDDTKKIEINPRIGNKGQFSSFQLSYNHYQKRIWVETFWSCNGKSQYFDTEYKAIEWIKTEYRKCYCN